VYEQFPNEVVGKRRRLQSKGWSTEVKEIQPGSPTTPCTWMVDQLESRVPRRWA